MVAVQSGVAALDVASGWSQLLRNSMGRPAACRPDARTLRTKNPLLVRLGPQAAPAGESETDQGTHVATTPATTKAMPAAEFAPWFLNAGGR